MRKITRSFLSALALALFSVASYAQDGSFTLSTEATDGMLTPTLTWETNADSCVASGDADWEGQKPGSGSETLSARPTTQARAFALVCSTPDDTQALLSWIPPTENSDGSALTNLAGYRVHWGQSAEQLVQVAQVDNPAATSFTIEDLAPGTTYYFGVRAFTSQGAESALSNIVSKTARAGVEWSQQTGVKVPKAPTLGDIE